MSKPRGSTSQLSKDFKKQKSSLKKQTTNRKTQSASNATSTSFKARSITLPSQSVTKSRDENVVGRSNLSLDELVLHLRHPNAHVRRDALLGIRQIRQAHVRTFGDESFSQVFPSIARLVSDHDPGVRKIFLEVLDECLHVVPIRHLRSYAAHILLHVNSAMSHIFPDVRIDAIRALDVCVSIFKCESTNGWQRAFVEERHRSAAQSTSPNENAELHTAGSRTILCYLSFLGVSVVNAKDDRSLTKRCPVVSTDLSRGSLAIVLNSLLHFFEAASYTQGSSDGTPRDALFSFVLPSLRHISDREALEDFLRIPSDTPAASGSRLDEVQKLPLRHAHASASSSILQIFSESLTAMGTEEAFESRALPPTKGIGDSVRERLKMYECIGMQLENAFVEAAADLGANASASDTLSQRIVRTILRLTLILWRKVAKASKTQIELLRRFLNRVALNFPFGGQLDSIRESTHWNQWLDCDLAFCELSCISATLSSHTAMDKARTATNNLHSDIVRNYVNRVLRFHDIRRLRKERYEAILPSVWMLLNSDGDEDSRDAIVQGLLDHWSAISNSDETKLISTKFIGTLLQIDRYTSYNGCLHMMKTPLRTEMMTQWLGVSIPRQLWEMQCNHVAMTNASLGCLRSALLPKSSNKFDVSQNQAQEKGGWNDQLEKMLQVSFAPFFRIEHRKHGTVDGPYCRLPADLKRQARAVIAAMTNELRNPLLSATQKCVGPVS